MAKAVYLNPNQFQDYPVYYHTVAGTTAGPSVGGSDPIKINVGDNWYITLDADHVVSEATLVDVTQKTVALAMNGSLNDMFGIQTAPMRVLISGVHWHEPVPPTAPPAPGDVFSFDPIS